MAHRSLTLSQQNTLQRLRAKSRTDRFEGWVRTQDVGCARDLEHLLSRRLVEYREDEFGGWYRPVERKS